MHQSVMVRMPIGPDKTVLLTEQVKSEESDGIAARAEISWLVEVCRAVMYVQHKVLGLPDEKMHFVRYYLAEASRERKAEYIAQMEKRMREDYRRRTGKEAESFCVL